MQAGTKQVSKAALPLHEAPQLILEASIVRAVLLDTDLEAHPPIESKVLPRFGMGQHLVLKLHGASHGAMLISELGHTGSDVSVS